jgi:hypothetical protein
MKVATSILSFPFVSDPESNPHLGLISDAQAWSLVEEVRLAVVAGEDSRFSHCNLAVHDELVSSPREILAHTNHESVGLMTGLDQLFDGDFMLYVSGWNKLNSRITRKLESRLQSLLGLDADMMSAVDFELFLGRYENTYGGIHRAECANLQLVINGHKEFSIWDPSEFAGWDVEHVLDTYSGGREEYLMEDGREAAEVDTGIQLAGKKGSLFYIPHGWWHVARSPEVSAAITFAIYQH